MVSAPDSGSRGLGSIPGQGHCFVLMCKTLYSQCLSPLRSIMGTSELSEKPDKMLGGYQRWTSTTGTTSILSRKSSNTPSRFML